MQHFSGNNRFLSYFSLVILTVLFLLEIYYASPYAATWDQVDFALALDRYDLLAMQPHFPGYPYFVLGGMFVHAFVDNPAKALSVFNVIALFSATVPIVLLLKKHFPTPISLFISTLIQSASYVMVIAGQPMSDGAALAVLWWYFWSIESARSRDAWWMRLLPLALLSILMGIRLSYAPFAVAILCLWYEDWKKHRSISRLGCFLTAAAFFQFIWIAAVAVAEGSFQSFFKLALSFTSGHFAEWGGTAANGMQPLWERGSQFFFYNILWTGIASQNVILLFLYIMVWAAVWRMRTSPFPRWLLVSGFAYFLWALFAQNIEKPRHILPFVHLGLLYGWTCYIRNHMSMYRWGLAAAVLAVQLATGTWHLREQALQLPATYQLAYDLQKSEERLVLYTWEETRVLQYLNVDFPHKDVLHFSFFLQDKANYRHVKIYLTDHVVKGFQAQGVSLSRHVRKVKTYRSSTLADPVYGNVTLYEWRN
ncbi:nuclear pore complex Nup93/Nic96 family protein [Parageobacillus thermoglucosidasius]|uniref:Nucleoporin-interacting protein n=1 Tax=Parageobacillus thermoglucosidasius TaxID=1426 RepID=A0AB38QY46_PARTM|nr:nuclear pore complex Nup93/Nic96 family protein [Parageobacillus thermoglucosidasius]UOE75593.1 nucleoporin-interacting protein [Parageobacillus thermoglucosidasius]